MRGPDTRSRLGRRAILSGGALALAFPHLVRAGEPAGPRLEVFGTDPQNLATPKDLFAQLITPNDRFFIRSHFGPPALDAGRRLAIEGLVRRPLTLSPAELRARFPAVTVTAVLQCAGNGRALHVPRVPGVQWVHGALGQATFTGARLRDVLAWAGVVPDAAFVTLAGADAPPRPSVPAFVRSIPLARALDPTTLVAWAMNGAPLTLAHGAPLRLVVPGWAGDHWVKWLTHLRLERQEAEGFYMRTAYKYPVRPVEPGAAVRPEDMRSLTTFPVKSLIARPADGGRAPAGPQEVAGCAFSGEAPIRSVEVSTDGGRSWQGARLSGKAEAGRWQIWTHRFVAAPGRASAMVRATDRKGNAQPQRAAWNPSGYFWNAWHSVAWEVL